MAKQGIVTSGEVAFSHLTEFDKYKNKSTGNYTLTITMDEAEASRLRDMGVQVKEYQKNDSEPVKLQRKFKSQFNVRVVDIDNHPFSGEIPYGSKVRVLWTTGEPSADYGVPTYLQQVRVVDLAEAPVEAPEDF